MILLALIGISCSENEEKTYLIGFSQCISSDDWRKSMHDEMYREVSFYDNLVLSIKDAEGNSQKQIAQIESFIAQDVDLLIVSPNESDPITPYVESAIDKGIPVIVLDRKTSSKKYTAYIGGDNMDIGVSAGEFLRTKLNSGRVLEVWGLKGSSPAVARSKGFEKALGDNFNIVPIYSDWTANTAIREFRKSKLDLSSFDAIYAHNDVMAMALYEKAQELGIDDLIIIGVDGLAGPVGGMQMVAEGALDATFLYPTGGEEAIRLASEILLGQGGVPKENLLPTTQIDQENVRMMRLQADKLIKQQKNIERQQTKISEQVRIYQNQRVLIIIISISFGLSILLAAYIFYSLREKQEINRRLTQKNEEILSQKDKIEQISRKAEEATKAKFQFFTNISHEFRTPITLIIGPLESLIESKQLNDSVKNQLSLVRKNAFRLLRLVNQLMEFRKLENKKIKLTITKQDLVAYVSEIKQAFDTIASTRHIAYHFVPRVKSIETWFDINMIDKVIFNSLSNAFKFIEDRTGEIEISVGLTEDGHFAQIIISDNGRGMSEEHLKHAFDRFYSGENYQTRGTGLGLSLSKELIDLHKGEIHIESQKNKGTKVFIKIRMGNEHFEKSVLKSNDHVVRLEATEFVSELGMQEFFGDNLMDVEHEAEHSVLIVEDSKDLQEFLFQALRNEFDIYRASNGVEALEIASEKVPDVIICDLMIEGDLTGLELTKKLRVDVRTSHIPIIQLTARTTDEHRIAGIASGANQYITKPFSLHFLKESIKTQINNRDQLRRHYKDEDHTDEPDLSNIDQRFAKKFRNLVKSSLSNMDLSPQMIAEELGVSRVQLYRKVKVLFGMGVNDYLVEQRLKYATELLTKHDLSIAEISYKVGFSSPTYFSTVFKTKHGVSPSEYKRKSGG
jgi:signal transduction histidine kinase/DNA-binding response OmpR family regulator